jgi:DNA-binding transcriptional LysR family regulator
VAFLAEASQIVGGFQSALRRLRQIGGKHAGHVTIAVAPSLLQRLLGPSIAQFRTMYPGVHLVIRDDVAGKVEELAVSGEADFGLASRWRENPEIDYFPIGSDQFGLACHQSHRLATGEVRLRDIDPAEIISLRQDTGIAQMLESAASLPDSLRRGPLTVHSTIAQLLLIAQNSGVALLPEYAAGVLPGAGIVYRAVVDLHLSRPLFLMRRRDITMSPAASSLFDFLIERKAAMLEVT